MGGNWEQLAGGVAACVVVGGAVLGGFRHYLIHEVKSEMKPNGGDSFRDHIDRRFDRLDERIDRFDDRLTKGGL